MKESLQKNYLNGCCMGDCEICGRSSDILYIVELEGARMSVCERCSKGKSIISKIGSEHEAPTRPSAREEEPEDEIIEGYGEKIRKAREALGIPMKVFAERINEKESNLIRVENERTLPTEKLVVKLERELNIKILIKPKADAGNSKIKKGKNEPLTLGDIAFRKEPSD